MSLPHLLRVAASAAVALTAAASAQPPVFTPLGVMPGHDDSVVQAISADGQTVIGQSMAIAPPGISLVYAWTPVLGFRHLAPVTGHESARPRAIDSTGSIVVGNSGNGAGEQPVKWITGFPIPIPLALLPGSSSAQTDCASADAQIVFGRAVGVVGVVRWNGQNPTPIGALIPSAPATPVAASSDGSVVVGVARNQQERDVAFRWTSATGFVSLGFLPGGDESYAAAVSADGQVVAGNAKSSNGRVAFRWTQATGMVPLPSLPNFTTYSYVWDMSADASLIVGECFGSGTPRAIIWRDGQAIDLHNLLVSRGVDLEGWTLRQVRSVSDDGRFLAGIATHQLSPTQFRTEAFHLFLPCAPDLSASAVPGSPGYGVPNGSLSSDDFFYYLAQFAASNLAVADLTTTAVPGSPGYATPNGVINNDDFFFYLGLYASGC